MYILKILVLTSTRYIYQKLHKFRKFEHSIFYNIFHLIWIVLIGSNHGKRFRLFKDKNANYDAINWNIRKEAKNIFLFVGDSHGEFWGRNFKDNFSKDFLFLTVWLGPILLINFLKKKKIREVSFFLVNNLLRFYGKKKNYHLIFSFGEIDIRTSIYRSIFFNKCFRNEDDLFEYYKKNLILVSNLIKKNIDKNYNVKFYFKEPTPQNKMTGLKPKSKFEMNNEYKKEQHPVFGDAKQRLSWHKKLKKILSNSNKDFKFIDNPKNFSDRKGLLLKNISDGIHVNSSIVLIEFQKKLMKI